MDGWLDGSMGLEPIHHIYFNISLGYTHRPSWYPFSKVSRRIFRFRRDRPTIAGGPSKLLTWMNGWMDGWGCDKLMGSAVSVLYSNTSPKRKGEV